MTDLVEPTTGARDLTQVAAVADHFVELMRTFNRARQRMIVASEHDVEWSSHIMLRCLKNEGSMRAGALADCLHSDPSTVSRQVAALVKDGLLERRADPGDGRASLLVLTDKADQVLADHDRLRVEYFGQVMTDWSDHDLTVFAAMLDRFAKAYEAADHEWIKDRLATRVDRSGSTD